MKCFLLSPVSRHQRRLYLYALVAAPIGLAGFVYAVVTLAVGLALSITLIGLPLVAAAVFGARRLGGFHRLLARKLLGLQIEPPPPMAKNRGLAGPLRDVPGWRAMAYLLIRGPLGMAYFAVLMVGIVQGLFVATYPIWWSLFNPTDVDKHGVKHHSALQLGTSYVDTWPRALLLAAAGVVWVYSAVWILRGLAWLDGELMKALLGPTRSERRIVDLTASRAHAVDDSAAVLRRIERDLHDGAQAQLVALAMQLGEAKENLDAPSGRVDLSETRALIETAHRNAKQAINELRDLARGIHPPALDNGLEDALGTLAARTSLPVSVHVATWERPAPAIESIAYFCVAELLTNAAKHAEPSRASVEVVQDGERLRLTVVDDGRGGARIGFAGGLAGLVDRVGTVDGRLDVDSPVGGPTVVAVVLPMRV